MYKKAFIECDLVILVLDVGLHEKKNTFLDIKVKSCYNPLRLETVIVLVSSGIDFVNTPRLYSDRATR